MEKINIPELISGISEAWKPKIIASLNGQEMKIARLQGDFIWHHHENEDEAFLVLEGTFDMHFRDKVVHLEKGDLIIVPKGVEHKPVADSEACVLLFEPAGTLNTGNVQNDKTVHSPLRL